MTSIERFLDILAQRDLLSDKLLASLRQQVAKSPKPIRPETLAKRLIDAGHLTPALAKRLLAAMPQTEAEANGAAQRAGSKERAPAASPPREESDDDLGLAPLDDEDARKPASASKVTKPAKTSPPSTKQHAKQSPPAKAKPPEQPSSDSSLLDEELAPLDSADGSLPPLDGLLAADAMDAAAGAGSPLAPLAAKQRGLFGWLKRGGQPSVPRHPEKVWESPVLLLSSGVLVGLLVLGAVLLWALGRQSGDEVLAAANEEYRAGSYTQAIHKFDQYLRRFPRHQGVSSARVKRGLARLRQATAEGNDWPAALATAQQVVKEISPEEAFSESAGELAAMLPAIAEGLAARAQKDNDPEVLAQAREAVELAGNRMIVPTRLQPRAKLDEIEAQLALVQRQIRQEAELDAAVAAIQTALDQRDAPFAYKTRQELLRTYPALADDPKLMAVTRAISAAQKLAVRVTEDAVEPGGELPTSPVSATLTLAELITKEPIAGAEGEVFITVVAGAAYGFNATDGRLMWKRLLGDASDGLRAPTGVVSAPGGDVFVLAPSREELWRLDAPTGHPRWRLPLGGPADVPPLLAKDRLVVATRGGRLHLIDAESGTSIRQIQLPQPVSVAPVVDAERGLIYQAADHSNLFVLELADGRCLDVVHLGHTQGSLAAPPVLATGVLLVPVNDRARTAVLRVYGTAGASQVAAPSGSEQAPAAAPGPLRLLQEFRVRGQFDMPPLVAGRGIVAVTDLGMVLAFELSAGDPGKPLVPIMQRETADTEPLARYGLFEGAQLFLADNRLTKFDLRAAEGRLVPQWVSDEQSAFLELPRPIGNAVVHVRRRIGEPGIIVAAVHAEEGRTLWQNRIAVPPAGRPVVRPGEKQLVVTGSTGATFQVDIDAFRAETVLNEPLVGTGQFRQPANSVAELGDGALLLSSGPGSSEVALLNPSEPSSGHVWRVLPGKLTSLPVAFQGGVLLPCLPGHLFLLDPRTNTPLAQPFQPSLTPEGRLDWRLPAVGDGRQVAVTDGRETLFALAIQPDPKPHFVPIALVELAVPVVAPLAATGNMVLTVNEAQAVIAYELPDLDNRGEWTLDSRCEWGPARVGDYVLLATEAGQLLCFDAEAQLRWRVALPDAPLAGATVLDDHLLLATAAGTLWRIDAGDGHEVGRVELRRPLATDPVPVGREVVVGGRTGSLYRVEVPQ